MSSNGIYYAKQKQKWMAQCRLNGKTTQLGAFDTPEEASMAYVTHKLTVKREPTPNDYVRLARYQSYCEFCKTPRTISEMFAHYPKSNTGSVRHVSDFLVEEGFIEKKTQSTKINAKDKYLYVTIKDFLDTDLKPMGRAQVQKLKFNKADYIQDEIIPGARVINFDDRKLQESYMLQRKLDRLSAKSPKNYISGATMSNSDW
jgi:hypothetical protein